MATNPSAESENILQLTETTMHAVDLPPELEDMLIPTQMASTGELKPQQREEFFPDMPTELLVPEMNLSDAPTELLTPDMNFVDAPTDVLSQDEYSSAGRTGKLSRDTAPYDPLHNAEQLPSLFPNKSRREETRKTQERKAPPTVVPRPKRKKNRAWRIIRRILLSILKWAFALVLAGAILVGGLLAYLTFTEFNPPLSGEPQIGNVSVSGNYDGGKLKIVTFNTGYAGLGKDADFFMDGGEGVTPESNELVIQNMDGIEELLKEIDADVIFLQEVDIDSKRSYNLDQWRLYESELEDYESVFAANYKCDFVPYPIGDFIGEVHSGIVTYSRFDILKSFRVSLPNNFSWPTRVANLKRCMLVTRHKVGGSEQELVLINCHLEAYDDDATRQEQFRTVLEYAEREYLNGNYVIIGGDFNQTFPNSDRFVPLKEENWVPGKLPELESNWTYAYDDSNPTCRLLDRPYDGVDTQFYVIDGFLVSDNLQIESVETIDGDFTYSDHNPVVLEVSLKQY